MPAYIVDGYSRSAFIKADEPSHEAVGFEFRPATRSEMSSWRTHREVVSGEEVAKRDAALLASHLISWDIRYPSGKTAGELVPISPENCGRLSDALTMKMINIVALIDAGDAKPGQSAPEKLDLQASLGN